MKDISQSELKSLLNYNPETGIFSWVNNYCVRGKIKREPGTISCGYHRIQINKKRYMSHRLAWLYMEGYLPEHEIDHIDRDRFNNKWSNLRSVSRSCNMRNRGFFKNNRSGVIGVSWHKKSNSWISQIVINGKKKYLGINKNLFKAVKIRFDAEIKYGFPNCNTTSTAYLFLKKEEHGQDGRVKK